MRDITSSVHASGSDVSQQLLDRDLTLTAKSLYGATTLASGQSSSPAELAECMLVKPLLHPTLPTTKEALQQHPQNSPAPKEGRLKLKMLACGFESQSATFGCVPLGKLLSLSGLQMSHLENGPNGTILLQVNAVTQDSAAH